MEWLVKNAVNRDVERQHLNKILQEIKTVIKDTTDQLAALKAANGQQDIQTIVGAMVTGNTERGVSVTYNEQKKTLDFIAKEFTISLKGAVTGIGTVTGLGSVVIDTTGAAGAAPNDGAFYWQHNGEWEVVVPNIETLQYLETEGFLVRATSDDGTGWVTREIEGTVDEIDVADGDAIAGNPVISLADLADSGDGVLLAIERDSKGRVSGTKPVTEGTGITITDIGASVEIAATGGGGGGSAAEYDLGDSSATTSGEFAIDLGGSS